MRRENMLRCNSQGFYNVDGRYESTDVRSTLPPKNKWKKIHSLWRLVVKVQITKQKGAKLKETPKEKKKSVNGATICLKEKISKCKMETGRKWSQTFKPLREVEY